MDFNRFTEKLQEAFRSAQSLAAKRGNQQIDVEHLLVALLEQESGLAQSILARAEVKLEEVHRRLIQELDKLPKVSGSGASPITCRRATVPAWRAAPTGPTRSSRPSPASNT